MRIKVLFYYVANSFLSNAMDKFCSVYKSNLSEGLTSLEDLRSGTSQLWCVGRYFRGKCGLFTRSEAPTW